MRKVGEKQMNIDTHPLSYAGISKAPICRRQLYPKVPNKAESLALRLFLEHPEINDSFESAVRRFEIIIYEFEEGPYPEIMKDLYIGDAKSRKETAKNPYKRIYFGLPLPKPETVLEKHWRKFKTKVDPYWKSVIDPIQEIWDATSLSSSAPLPIYARVPLFFVFSSLVLIDSLGEGLQRIDHVFKRSLEYLSNTSFSQEYAKTIEAIYFKNTTNPEQRRRAFLTFLATGGFTLPFILCYSGMKAAAKPWLYRDEQQEVNPETAVEPLHAE
jgi:hypothetical protein